MDGIPEDVAAEIEAIRAMYGGDDDDDDDEEDVDDDAMQKVLRIQKLMMTTRDDDDDDDGTPTVEIRLDATPSVSSSPDGTTYASATLVMTCAIDGSYPLKSAPTARLEDARGVEEEDERRVRRALDDAIEAHAGEHVMTLLCEIAREAMEGVNSPRGACAFCREDMGGGRCGKLSECWHAFHADCFVEWYEWREGVIRVELEGDGAHPPGSEEAKRARERAAHRCPVCRARVSDADADGFRRAAAAGSSTGGRTRTRRDASDEDARDALRALDADARAALEETRRRFEKSALAQDATGGRIDERTAGRGVVIDESTTFHRRDASASSSGAEISTAGKAAIPPLGESSSSRTTKASGSRGKKDWLARAARKPKPGSGDTP